MQMIDFVFDGEKLSDHSLILCTFDGISDSLDVGNMISINQVKAPNNDRYMSVGANYDSAYSPEFSICKNPCEDGDFFIESNEVNKIMRWLNRKYNCVFKPIYDDNSFSDVFYRGTFNIELVKNGTNIIGFNLTLNTDAPYGYQDLVTYTHTFVNKAIPLEIKDVSDEIGYIYCDVTLNILESGNLRIKNTLDPDNDIYIENCTNGETIELFGNQKIIEAPLSHTSIYNDFNYNFFRINNTYENTINEFTSTLQCKIIIKYYPIRKVGIIL